MPWNPRHLSLRGKLGLLVSVALGVVVATVLVAFPGRMETLARGSADDRARTLTVVLAKALAPAIDFDDAESAQELLSSLHTTPDVTYAAIMRGDRRWAGWGSRPPSLGEAGGQPRTIDRDGVLHAFLKLSQGERAGHQAGTLHIGFDLRKLESDLQSNVIFVVAVSSLVFLVALVLSLWLGTYLVRPIQTMTALAQRISEGDLTHGDISLDRSDEVGQMAAAFDKMVKAQRSVLKRVAQTAIEIHSAAMQIHAAAQEQEAAGTEQAAAVEEVARTMQSLLEAAGHIAETSRGVLDNAERTRETTDLTAGKIAELSSHTSRIAEILEVIRDIADRSDLLALNASLEATRAGDAGRTFALVAAEMRRLAERVTASVEDVKTLVADVRASSSSTIVATEENRKLVESTTDSARQITLVTQQQRTGTEQVSASMRDFSKIIAQAVASTQQTRQAAEDLREQARQLSEIVAPFRIGS